MKVGIDVQVRPGEHGGLAPALSSLLASLGTLDGSDEYLVIVRDGEARDWLSPLAANQRFVDYPAEAKPSRLQLAVGRRVRDWLGIPERGPHVPVSDGFYARAGCDVVHFPSWRYTICNRPTVYNPHDLQHVHFPQFFSPGTIARLETTFRAACQLSHTIIVNSQWVKADVERQYAVAPDKVQIIPEAPSTAWTRAPSADDLERVRRQYRIAPGFAFYPAVSWPHKNHFRLLEGVARLVALGRDVRVVCCGARDRQHHPLLEARVAELALGDRVRFLGFVPQDDLPSLYRLSACLILPTLFEANSLPMFEAWRERTPVISSNVTALPQQAGPAALLFDPYDVDAIASALDRGLHDRDLRERLRAEGERRLADFDWSRTARAYRAVYRRAAGQSLSDDDRELLAWDWMRDPPGRGVMSASPA